MRYKARTSGVQGRAHWSHRSRCLRPGPITSSSFGRCPLTLVCVTRGAFHRILDYFNYCLFRTFWLTGQWCSVSIFGSSSPTCGIGRR
ncbi:hypothetical protein FKM82_020991 [Ascaphus truei]